MIPFTVIGGYLGAGKTTLLNQMLREAGGRRIALLINDFGAINIDASLIESATGARINLSNGCVCCTLTDGFFEAIESLLASDPLPEHIVVEASGVADVANLAQYGYGHDLELDGVIVLADAETVQAKASDKYVAATVRRQLAAADLIVLNKTDLAGRERTASVRAWLESTFAGSRVIEAVQANVPVALLLGIHTRDTVMTSAPHVHYRSWSFQSGIPVTEDKLNAWLAALPDTILRVKGVSVSRTGHRLVVQGVGRRREITASARDDEPGTRLVAIGLEGELDAEQLQALAGKYLSPQ